MSQPMVPDRGYTGEKERKKGELAMPIVIPSRDWGDLESDWISTDLSTWETPLRHGRLREYQPREQVFRQGEDFSSV